MKSVKLMLLLALSAGFSVNASLNSSDIHHLTTLELMELYRSQNKSALKFVVDCCCQKKSETEKKSWYLQSAQIYANSESTYDKEMQHFYLAMHEAKNESEKNTLIENYSVIFQQGCNEFSRFNFEVQR